MSLYFRIANAFRANERVLYDENYFTYENCFQCVAFTLQIGTQLKYKTHHINARHFIHKLFVFINSTSTSLILLKINSSLTTVSCDNENILIILRWKNRFIEYSMKEKTSFFSSTSFILLCSGFRYKYFHYSVTCIFILSFNKSFFQFVFFSRSSPFQIIWYAAFELLFWNSFFINLMKLCSQNFI